VKYYTNKARQAGMTLIELTVVLLVLIGLAGLMIPYVSGFISKTHDSTGASSLGEVTKSMIRYETQFQGFPDDMDSLISTSGGTDSVFTKMMNSGLYTALALTSSEVEGLTNVGIDSVLAMNESGLSATFDSSLITPVSISGGATFASLNLTSGTSSMMATNTTDLQTELGGHVIDTDNNYYIVFGIGSGSSMIGKTIHEAPVHFAQTGNMSADSKYNRLVALFEVPKSGMMPRAKFLGSLMPMMALEGKTGALNSHYSSLD